VKSEQELFSRAGKLAKQTWKMMAKGAEPWRSTGKSLLSPAPASAEQEMLGSVHKHADCFTSCHRPMANNIKWQHQRNWQEQMNEKS